MSYIQNEAALCPVGAELDGSKLGNNGCAEGEETIVTGRIDWAGMGRLVGRTR